MEQFNEVLLYLTELWHIYINHGRDGSVRLVRLEVCLPNVEPKMLVQSNFLTNMGQDR